MATIMRRRSSPQRLRLGIVTTLLLTSHGILADEIRIGRYQSLVLTPDSGQADALGAVITPQFPDDITTIGEAIRFLLQPTGYQLPAAPGPCEALLFAQPLPAAQRRLGAVTVRHALAQLAGSAYRPVVDTLYRRVNFERADGTTDNASACDRE